MTWLTMTIPKRTKKLRPAKTIPEGGYFRKKNGREIYLRMSVSSVKFLNLPQNFIYGVARYSGNVARVDEDTMLYRMKSFDDVDDDMRAQVVQKRDDTEWEVFELAEAADNVHTSYDGYGYGYYGNATEVFFDCPAEDGKDIEWEAPAEATHVYWAWDYG